MTSEQTQDFYDNPVEMAALLDRMKRDPKLALTLAQGVILEGVVIDEDDEEDEDGLPIPRPGWCDPIKETTND